MGKILIDLSVAIGVCHISWLRAMRACFWINNILIFTAGKHVDFQHSGSNHLKTDTAHFASTHLRRTNT